MPNEIKELKLVTPINFNELSRIINGYNPPSFVKAAANIQKMAMGGFALSSAH